jgi:hypothetical protein
MNKEQIKNRSRFIGELFIFFAFFSFTSTIGRMDFNEIDIRYWFIVICPIVMGILFILHKKFSIYLLVGYVFFFYFFAIKTSIIQRTIAPVIFCTITLIIPLFFFLKWWKKIHTELKNDVVLKKIKGMISDSYFSR